AYINDAQRTIIENYLNVKFGITISNDVFASGDPSYSYDLTGIGQESDGNHTSSVSGTTGFYIESTGSLDNGDYIMFAHNSSANSVSTSDITGGVQERWAKDWYIEQTGSQNAQIIFDLPEGIAGGQYPQNISNYVLLYRSGTSGNYSIATISSVDYADADQVSFSILGTSLADGYYTLGTLDQTNSPVLGQAGTTWYSLVSGNWSDPNIWTLDPSGALPNNPSNSYPQFNTDKVVIKTGKTVTMDLPDPTYTFASVTVNGRLDLQSKSGLTFSEIKGTGRILMSDDVFPSYSNADDFIKAGQGEGTVALYGNNFTLNTAHEFYNLEVEMNAGQTITLTKDLTLNGYFRVESGTFKINDDASTTGLNISVAGDANILAGAFLSTGTGNARHQFDFYGDLTNNGELRFTNRVAANYTAEATDGIVDANFLSSTTNQDVICNGISNFYRIEIDKGTDKTYILAIEASSTANFNLFGYANQGHNSIAQLDDGAAAAGDRNPNALGLYRGTVKIGNNVNIPVLNNTGNYNISEAAQLWVDGGTVAKSAGTAIVPYGVARVSAGTFTASVGSGFTLRDNGLIKVEGGSLNATQIRTSVLGIGNVGGYVQSGGTAIIDGSLGGTPQADYYIFSLTYPGNVFTMSGGTLTVRGVRNMIDRTGGASGDWHGGAIFINSDPENINVTGGTVIMDISTNTTTTPATNYKITSRAPFYNVIMRKTNAGSDDVFTLEGGTSGDNAAGEYYTLPGQPLKVLNDFKIEGEETSVGYPNIDFYAVTSPTNVNDVYIGGSFIIEAGAQYWTAADGDRSRNYNGVANQPTIVNTTYFNQTIGTSAIDTLYWGNVGDQFDYDSNSTPDADENMAEFGHFVLDRTSGNELRLVSPGPGSGLRGNSSLTVDVNGDASVLSGTFDQGRLTLRIWGAITNYDRFGTWYENGSYPVNNGTPSTAQIRFREDPPVVINTKDNAIFGNIRFNVNTSTSVELNSDVYIERMEFLRGAIYLKNHHLKIDYMWNVADNIFEDVTTSSILRLSNTGLVGDNIIYTDGKASDGGLSVKIIQNSLAETTGNRRNNLSPITFPVGFKTAGYHYFRPVQVNVSGFQSDSGYVRIRPVSGELKTTDLSGGELLQHYWRVSYSDFTDLPTNIALRFYYRNQSGVAGVDLPTGSINEANYVPGYVLDGTPYTRNYESSPIQDVDDVYNSSFDTDTRILVFNGTSSTGEFIQGSYNGFEPINANYTTGVAGRFVGAPQIFYTHRPGDGFTIKWNNGNNWTFAPNDIDGNLTIDDYELHDSRQPAAGDWPQAGDVAVIGWIPFGDPGGTDGYPHGIAVDGIAVDFAEIMFSQMLDISGNPTERQYAYNFQFRPTVVINDAGGALNGSRISGEGLFWMRWGGSQADPDFSSIDIGDFVNQDSSYFVYESKGGVYNNVPSEVPNLLIAGDGWGANDRNFELSTNLRVNANFELLGDVNLILSSGTAGDIIVEKDLRIFTRSTIGGFGRIDYPNDASRSIEVYGDLKLENEQALIRVASPNTTIDESQLIVHGNIYQDNISGGGLQLYTAVDQDYVKLTLSGAGNHAYNVNSGATANLFNIEFDKGTDQSSSFSFNSDFSLNAPTSGVGVTKALDLQNGTCILNNGSINIDLTTGDDDYVIPSTACIEVRQGQVNAIGN
ncbi:MAG: hypothetical protein HC831_16090, partial [Chloroflexia bacterium]|nr:hypothetical protein [Chloroflexia bacterium]